MFGGSFDPIHAGHVAVVEYLLARGLAGIVHVVPAWRSPFKKRRCRASPRVRLLLVELAFAGRDEVAVEDLEIKRRKTSYTVDTLAELVVRHPDDRWRLIIGADHAASFASWRRPERLLEMAEPVIFARGNRAVCGMLASRSLVVDDFDHPANATAIRRELSRGRVPGPELLPPAVAARIQADGLYGLGGGVPKPRRKGGP